MINAEKYGFKVEARSPQAEEWTVTKKDATTLGIMFEDRSFNDRKALAPFDACRSSDANVLFAWMRGKKVENIINLGSAFFLYHPHFTAEDSEGGKHLDDFIKSIGRVLKGDHALLRRLRELMAKSEDCFVYTDDDGDTPI